MRVPHDQLLDHFGVERDAGGIEAVALGEATEVQEQQHAVGREGLLHLHGVTLGQVLALALVEADTLVCDRRRHHHQRAAHDAAQLLHRIGLPLRLRFHLLAAADDVLLDHREQQLVLGAEVPVEGLQRDTGALGHLLHRELAVTLVGQLLGGVDQHRGGIVASGGGRLGPRSARRPHGRPAAPIADRPSPASRRPARLSRRRTLVERGSCRHENDSGRVAVTPRASRTSRARRRPR